MKKIILVLIAVILTTGIIAGWVYYLRAKNQVDITTLIQQKEQLDDFSNKDQVLAQNLDKDKSDSADLKTYSNEELGFEFQYPSEYTFSPRVKNWDEEKQSNNLLEGYRGSYFFGALSVDDHPVMQFMFLSKDYRELGGRGGGFSDINRYTFNANENKYYLGDWWDDDLREIKGSVRNISVDGKEGILIDYNEFLKSRDCVAGYPFPYLASLIKTGQDRYPLLTISVDDVLIDAEKCIFSKPLSDEVALKIIKSFKFVDK